MERVTGIGGIFFKAHDPAELKAWYREHLGIVRKPDGFIAFEWREKDDPDRTLRRSLCLREMTSSGPGRNLAVPPGA